MEITKETTMGEMLAYDEKIAYILMQEGMHCIGARLLSVSLLRRHAWYMDLM